MTRQIDTQIRGIHHVTAITSSAQKIYDFFTDILGLRLIKKTVNQDDIQTYHLYFTDDKGSAGTDVTFFDFPGIPKGTKGTNSISKLSFRVKDDATLAFWKERFDTFNIKHSEIKEQFHRKYLEFEDFDEQAYQLISDEHDQGVKGGIPWKNAPVPEDKAIIGLGPVVVTVKNLEHMKLVLGKDILGFTQTAKDGDDYLFEVGKGGNGASIIVRYAPHLEPSLQGYGTVHHLALRVADEQALQHWISKISALQFPHSGLVDRFYFKSEYFTVAPGILFELATDGPGFLQDETYETAGEKLSLPPFLENQRTHIENMIRPFDTTRHNKKRSQ